MGQREEREKRKWQRAREKCKAEVGWEVRKEKENPQPGPAVVKHLQSPRGKKKGGQASGRSAHTKDKIKKEHPLYV